MDLKSILESVLFVNERPVSADDIAKYLDFEKKEVLSAFEELKGEYEQRESGLSIVSVSGGYQMCTAPQNSGWIKKIYKERFKRKLSPASLEVLAIIAYKQPVTKLEVEAIRGVDCGQVVKGLLNIGLIKIKGRKDVIGKPFLYGTTRKFLEYFGLNSLSDLPQRGSDKSYKDGLPETVDKDENFVSEEDSSSLENMPYLDETNDASAGGNLNNSDSRGLEVSPDEDLEKDNRK